MGFEHNLLSRLTQFSPDLYWDIIRVRIRRILIATTHGPFFKHL